MLGRVRFAQYRLLPSWWLSAGLLEAAGGDWSEGLKFLALMIANALFCRQVAIWTSLRLYRPAYVALHTMAHARRKARAGWIDRSLIRALRLLPPAMRWMMIKDLRLFRRDSAQWSQFLIFFGLLVLYFVNIHPFSYESNYAGWVNMVSFLNLTVVGLLMSTFTTRFIFPMLSLEGRRFWLLGLLPVRRETILWSKFAFALAASLLPCSALIALSDLMLRVSLLVLVIHQATCLILCLGLSGIAVGLGGAAAQPPRAVHLADRRRLRRHAQPGRQHALHPRHRAVDGAALPLLFRGRCQPWDDGRAGHGHLAMVAADVDHLRNRRQHRAGPGGDDSAPEDRPPRHSPMGVLIACAGGAAIRDCIARGGSHVHAGSFIYPPKPTGCVRWDCGTGGDSGISPRLTPGACPRCA